METKLIATAVAMAMASCAFAELVSDKAIEQAATSWLSSDRVAQMTMKGLSFDKLEYRGSLRVVRLSPTGYIIMSGSDIADPVISFSRNNFIEPEEGSPFHAMLEHSDSNVQKHEEAGGVRTAKWMELIGGRNGSKPKAWRLLASSSPEEDSSTILIAPFMTTLWNQWQPWNDFCPVIDPDADDMLYRARSACGCVATATAQQIAYCRWPWRTGRSDTWVHTLDADGEIEEDGRYAESEFPVRFDGHLPFDWDSMLDVYSWWWGDARGKIAESERFPVARFVSWVDVITKMNFGKNGSGANFGNTDDSTADWYEAWEYIDLKKDYDYGVAKIKSDMEFGVPVHVGVPGHSVIAHGYASDGESDWLYINYGWSGSSDGWYKICDETSSSPVDNAFPGFRPKKMVQLEPLPKVCGSDVDVKWHLPPCYDGSVTGFEVEAIVFGSQVGSETCNFTDSVGVPSDPARIYVTNGVEEVRNESDFLWFGSWMSGTYDLPGERILTSGSVLSYRVSSADVGDRDVEILASFDGGAWQTVSKPILCRNYWSGSWISQEVFLGEHAGKIARFRIKAGWAGGRVLFDDFTFSNVIQPSVVFRRAVAPELRAYTVSGFSEGVLAGVSITPIFADGGGIKSECELTRIAGRAKLPVPVTITEYTTDDAVYTSEVANDTWSLRGIADGETIIRAHNAWSGGFEVALPGKLTEQSTLSFSWYETGCYALDTEYDTITATFVDDAGAETDFWCITNQNQQTERQLVEIPLSRFAGKLGGVKLVFGHNGANYTGNGYIMRFYSPRISNVAMPVLPEARWESRTFAALPLPRIDSVKGRDGLEIDEGLYREIEIGEDTLRVSCSATVESLRAYPSHLSLMDDNDVSVEKITTGEFLVRMNTARAVRRSRMILTLAATDGNGTTVYRDVSLRFDTASAVKLIDGWRAMDALGFKPSNAFTFDNSMLNAANGPLEIGGGNVSYVESPLGFALHHNGDDGPWTKPRLNMPEEWTVLTMARLSDVNNAVLFQFGSSEYDQSGFALASGGKDRVTLSHWRPHSQHVDLLSASVPHASSQYHAYVIRARGKFVELFIDGIYAGCATLPTIPAVGFQLFSVIQGNGDTRLTNASGEYMEDWRMYDAALPVTVIAQYVNLLAEFDADYPPGWRVNVVTFDPKGGELPDAVRTLVSGTAVGDLPNPTREGYVLDGWYTSDIGGDLVTANTVVSGDATFYAHWTELSAITYVITYSPGANGTGLQQTAKKTRGVTLKLLDAIFTRTGYTQTGWTTTDGGEKEYDLGASYAEDVAVTLYPVWTENGGEEPGEEPGGEPGEEPGGEPGEEPGGEPGEEPGGKPGEEPGGGSGTDQPDIPTPVIAESVKYILYQSIVGAAPTAASTYEGYLYDASGNVKGTIQVKVGKPNKKTGLAAVKATVIGTDGKKKTLKAAEKGKAQIAGDGPTTIPLAGGDACEVILGAKGMGGTYGAYVIDGSLNVFASKDAADKSVAAGVLGKWKGAVNVAWRRVEDNAPYQTLSVAIAAKGKAKVAGTLADGTKVSAKGQLVVGEEWCCVPVVVAKKAKLAFAVWLPVDEKAAGTAAPHGAAAPAVVGLGGDVKVGKPGALKAGAAFRLGGEMGDAKYGAYLPNGVAVSGGAKWTLPKAGKVVYAKGTTTVDEAKAGENPSGLKLTYKAKDGTFKGSFKAYADVGGKPKGTTVKVTGVLVGGVGYGAATVKGGSGVAVTIE